MDYFKYLEKYCMEYVFHAIIKKKTLLYTFYAPAGAERSYHVKV